MPQNEKVQQLLHFLTHKHVSAQLKFEITNTSVEIVATHRDCSSFGFMREVSSMEEPKKEKEVWRNGGECHRVRECNRLLRLTGTAAASDSPRPMEWSRSGRWNSGT